MTFVSIIDRDALEEEREKNNHLADKLETLRRQHSSLESEVGRTEAVSREREHADNKFIKVRVGKGQNRLGNNIYINVLVVGNWFLRLTVSTV